VIISNDAGVKQMKYAVLGHCNTLHAARENVFAVEGPANCRQIKMVV